VFNSKLTRATTFVCVGVVQMVYFVMAVIREVVVNQKRLQSKRVSPIISVAVKALRTFHFAMGHTVSTVMMMWDPRSLRKVLKVSDGLR